MTPSSSPPPVTVLSGFLGAGKTTVLRHWLTQSAGRRWAAVVNDVAAINIDAQLVRAAGAQRVIELGNGCVCCSVRDELAETVAELSASGQYEHILVETTGVADPRAIADLFIRRNAFGKALGDFARLHTLVTVIDAKAFFAAWQASTTRPAATADAAASQARGVKPIFELMLDQAECADLLVLNKADLVSAEEMIRLEAVLAELNPRARLIRAEQGRIGWDAMLGAPRFEPAQTLTAAKWIRVLNQVDRGGVNVRVPRHQTEYGITSFEFEARRPFQREKFLAWVHTQLPGGLLRAKGFFWLSEQPADIGFLSVAGGLARTDFVGTWSAALREQGVISAAEIPATARERWVEPDGDRRQELVFIGLEVDERRVRAGLEACLVAGAERS